MKAFGELYGNPGDLPDSNRVYILLPGPGGNIQTDHAPVMNRNHSLPPIYNEQDLAVRDMLARADQVGPSP